jgi:hypothetical protein
MQFEFDKSFEKALSKLGKSCLQIWIFTLTHPKKPNPKNPANTSHNSSLLNSDSEKFTPTK